MEGRAKQHCIVAAIFLLLSPSSSLSVSSPVLSTERIAIIKNPDSAPDHGVDCLVAAVIRFQLPLGLSYILHSSAKGNSYIAK